MVRVVTRPVPAPVRQEHVSTACTFQGIIIAPATDKRNARFSLVANAAILTWMVKFCPVHVRTAPALAVTVRTATRLTRRVVAALAVTRPVHAVVALAHAVAIPAVTAHAHAVAIPVVAAHAYAVAVPVVAAHAVPVRAIVVFTSRLKKKRWNVVAAKVSAVILRSKDPEMVENVNCREKRKAPNSLIARCLRFLCFRFAITMVKYRWLLTTSC